MIFDPHKPMRIRRKKDLYCEGKTILDYFCGEEIEDFIMDSNIMKIQFRRGRQPNSCIDYSKRYTCCISSDLDLIFENFDDSSIIYDDYECTRLDALLSEM